MSFSKTESVSLHLSGQKNFPPMLKSVSNGPTIMNVLLKANYNYYYYYLNIGILYYYYILIRIT